MPERVYMGVDWRRDHSFRVPRPDLFAQTDAPDACTDCHAERSPAVQLRLVQDLVDMRAARDAGGLTIKPIRTMMNHSTTEVQVYLESIDLKY